MAAPPQRLLGGVAAVLGRMLGMLGMLGMFAAAVLHLGLIAALAVHLVLCGSARRVMLRMLCLRIGRRSGLRRNRRSHEKRESADKHLHLKSPIV